MVLRRPASRHRRRALNAHLSARYFTRYIGFGLRTALRTDGDRYGD